MAKQKRVASLPSVLEASHGASSPPTHNREPDDTLLLPSQRRGVLAPRAAAARADGYPTGATAIVLKVSHRGPDGSTNTARKSTQADPSAHSLSNMTDERERGDADRAERARDPNGR